MQPHYRVSRSVHIMECDLGSFSSVRAFAAQLLARVGAVDMLMLFAGAADPLVPTTTEDGVEMVYQVLPEPLECPAPRPATTAVVSLDLQ